MAYSVQYLYKVIDKYTVPLARIQRKTKAFERQMMITNAAMRALDSTVLKTKKSINLYSGSLNKTNAQHVALGQAAAQAAAKAAHLADKEAEVARKTDTAARSFTRINTKLLTFHKRMSDAKRKMADSGIGKWNKDLQGVGRTLTTRVTLPLAVVGGASLKMSMDFNKGMANVATLIPGNVSRVEMLKREVQGMALETGIATGTMTGGLYQVISAFGDTSETSKVLKINAKAAAAGIATVHDSVNLTSAVMKSYGDTSANAALRTADLAFQTVKLGQTTFPELASSMGRVIPLAATLGVGQEKLFAQFATLTGVTGRTAEVSTQLAGAYRAFLKPTEQMKKAIKFLGYDSAKALMSGKGLVPAMQALVKITGGSEEKLTKLFGRMEPLVALFSLTGAQADTYSKKLAQMEVATGAMNEAFKEQTEGINKTGFAWSRFKVRMSIAAQKLGDRLSPAFTKVLKVGGLFLKLWDKLPAPMKNVIVITAALAATLGPTIIGVTAMVAGFQILSIAASALGISLGAIASITGVIGLAFIAVGAAVYQVTKHLSALTYEAIRFKDAVVDFFSGDANFLGGLKLIAEQLTLIYDTLMGIDKLKTAVKVLATPVAKAKTAEETWQDEVAYSKARQQRAAAESPMAGRMEAMKGTLNGMIGIEASPGTEVTGAEMETDLPGNLGFSMGT